MNQEHETAAADEKKEVNKSFKIQIDRVHYDVELAEMTGEQLRLVPATAIGVDRDLFEVVPGASDQKIGDQDIVQIHNGKRFFTAPGQINPGFFVG